MATDAIPKAIPPTDHYQVVCGQIPNLTVSQKLDVIEQLARSVRSTADKAQAPQSDLEKDREAKRKVLAFLDELEHEAREADQEIGQMTDRDHDRIIYEL